MRHGNTSAYFRAHVGINGFLTIADTFYNAMTCGGITVDELARAMSTCSWRKPKNKKVKT